MTVYNIVRMRPKPDQEQAFLDHLRTDDVLYEGLRSLKVVHTGEREYVLLGEWDNMDRLAAAREDMIAELDIFRDWLEDLGHGLGVTDPRSGDVVVEFAG